MFLMMGLCLLFGDAVDESAAIKKAALGYLDGWFKSNPELMESALHENLTKYRVNTTKGGTTQYLDVMTKAELVGICHVNQKWVEGKGHQGPEILFQNKDIAVVYAQSDGFYDLINLAKVNGEWKIVQVLWQVGEGKPKSSENGK